MASTDLSKLSANQVHSLLQNYPDMDWSKPGYAPNLAGDVAKQYMALTPALIVLRILGGNSRFLINQHTENWEGHPPILHIALLDTASKVIVRFEEDPLKFPSDALIDKLRLLR